MSNEVETNNVNTEVQDVQNVSEEVKVESNETVAEVKEESVKASEEVKESSWLDNISPEFKDSSYLKGFEGKDLNEFVKSAINAQSLIGKKVDEFSKENIEAFYKKMGKPEEYVAPEKLAEDTKATLIEAANEANLTQEQFNKIADKLAVYNESTNKAKEEAYKQSQEAAEYELKKEFGDAFENRMELAKNAVVELFGEETSKLVLEGDLGNNPDFIKGMAKVGLTFKEDTIVSTDKKGTFGVTPDEAMKEINGLKKDADFMKKYLGEGEFRNSKAHNEAVEKMASLFKLAYPEG